MQLHHDLPHYNYTTNPIDKILTDILHFHPRYIRCLRLDKFTISPESLLSLGLQLPSLQELGFFVDSEECVSSITCYIRCASSAGRSHGYRSCVLRRHWRCSGWPCQETPSGLLFTRSNVSWFRRCLTCESCMSINFSPSLAQLSFGRWALIDFAGMVGIVCWFWDRAVGHMTLPKKRCSALSPQSTCPQVLTLVNMMHNVIICTL